MGMFHPVYGELMTAKEVSNATGHTMNQLRNWRNEARKDLAPFGSILLGATSYYRQVVIQAWIDRNGRQDGKYHQTALDREFPLNVAVQGDAKKNEAIALLTAITPENVDSFRLRITADSANEVAYNWATKGARKYVAQEIGEFNPATRIITSKTRHQEPVWFTGMVKAMRMAQNEMSNLGFTEEEVLALPIGQVPPLKEIKYNG